MAGARLWILLKKWLPRLADALFPRRCPFVGRCWARMPWGDRLPGLRARRNAAAAHPTAPAGRGAQLLCPEPGCRSLLLCRHGAQCDFALQTRRQPLACQELADRMAVLVFGALPARRVGGLPQYLGVAMLPLYNCIVPVPPPPAAARCAWPAAAAGAALGAGVGDPGGNAAFGPPRHPPAEGADPDERLQNARGVCLPPGADLTGKRVLLVDDIITTGRRRRPVRWPCCKAGATDVTVAAVAVAEELPKEKRKKNEMRLYAPTSARRGVGFCARRIFGQILWVCPSCRQAHKYFV